MASDDFKPTVIDPQVEIEKTLLGMSLHPDGGKHFLDDITADDFTDKRHKNIYGALMASPTNDPLICRAQMNPPADAKMRAYMTEVAFEQFSTANVEFYRRQLRHATLHRKSRKLAGQIDTAHKAGDDNRARQMTEELHALANQMHEGNAGLVPLREILPGVMHQIEAAYKAGGENTGIPTDIYALDDLTAGWQPSDLIVVAGRPGMGKTSLAMLFARVAAKKGNHVGVFSLEMSSGQLVRRLLARESGINLMDIRRATLSDDDWTRLVDMGGRLWNSRIYLDDRGGLTVAQIREACLKQRSLDLVIVDYLQLGTAAGENQNVRISQISAGLKTLAKDLNVPIILLSQLNRAVEGREGKRPHMSDLRDSGAIEQDADLILLLFRAAAYEELAKEGNRHEAELTLAKQRNGPTGKVRLRWEPTTATFSNPAMRGET